MSAIKRFFEKKKLDTKFKLAGDGKRLTDQSSSKSHVEKKTPEHRQQPSASANRAGEAALARLQSQSATQSKKPISKTATWKKQMEEENHNISTQLNNMPPPLSPKKVSVEIASKVVEAVLHVCPVCPTVLPHKEVQEHLHDCLKRELEGEPLMISVTIIHTLNKDKGMIDNCVHVLGQYLQNLIDHPEEEKYRKIRKSNKAFIKKVSPVLGAEEFLLKGCGFELKTLPYESNGENIEEEFFVLNEVLASNSEQLLISKQMLNDAEPLEIHLDRNMRLYEPSTQANKMDVPSSFYTLTSAELKKEQTDKSKELDKSKQLRTKAMREAEYTNRKYLYTVIRIRFPDGILLQGTFSTRETLSDVKTYVQDHLCIDWVPFKLVDSLGKPFQDESMNLNTLKLVPSVVLNLSIDSTVASEIAAASVDGKIQYLKDEHLVLIQQL